MPDSEAKQALQNEVSDFLSKGLWLEGQIMKAGASIRDKSKSKYRHQCLDARLQLLSISAHLLDQKHGVPGNTSETISERLTLVMVFLQGVSATEDLISEGQYIKASAALKQDFELITRMAEVKHNASKQGKVPNVKFAPKGSQQYYGQLNDIAHPSNLFILQALLNQYQDGDARGISSVPIFVEETALALYELHVWLLFEAVREHVLLTIEMYGEDEPALKDIYRWFGNVIRALREIGLLIEPK